MKSRLKAFLTLFAVLATLAVGIVPRVRAKQVVQSDTLRMAAPTVVVVTPAKGDPSREIVLPANVQAFVDAPIYARTNGYLKRWTADIGAHVKAGQLLAEIDTPEADQQLEQARADLATAEANLHLAGITATRYTDLLSTDSASMQEADNATGDREAKKAIVASAQANVKRLAELQSFQRVYAPFDGVMTARNTDVGALIDSGSGGGPKTELFHVASLGRLRVFVDVPEGFSRAAVPGLAADLTLAEFPGRRFPGRLVRNASAIDPVTRTLLAEIDVDNPTGELLSGAYAEVHLKLPGPSQAFVLPANTLLFRSEGLRVATVTGTRVDLLPITLGRDFGDRVEVVAGLRGGESIVLDPPDSIVAGETVQIAKPAPSAGPGGAS